MAYNYKGKVNDYKIGNAYYIHKNRENIGKCINNQQLEDNQISAKLSSTNKINQINKALKNQYMLQLKAKNNKNVDKLKHITRIYNNIDEVFSKQGKVDKIIKEAFEERLNNKKLQTIIDDYLLGLFKEGGAFYNTIYDYENKTEIDNIANFISDIIDLFGKIYGNKDWIIGYIANTEFNAEDKIRNTLKSKLKDGEVISTSELDENQKIVADRINSIMENIAAKKYSKSGLIKTISNNLISTEIGETLIANIINQSLDSLQEGTNEAIKNNFNSKNKGNNLVKISLNKNSKTINGLSGRRATKVYGVKNQGTVLYELKSSKARSGKGDVSFKVKVTEKEIDVFYNVDLSVKTYTSASNNSLKIESGKGVRLGQALKQIYNENNMYLYLSYNVFAHNDNNNFQKSTAALNDLLMRSQFINFFAARGVKDFAQYIVVNGQILSIYEIIQNNITKQGSNYGLSSSMVKDSDNQALTISIDKENREMIHNGLTQGQKDDNYDYIRSLYINSLINNTSVTAKMDIMKLLPKNKN